MRTVLDNVVFGAVQSCPKFSLPRPWWNAAPSFAAPSNAAPYSRASTMEPESAQSELGRLRDEQAKTLHDEVFGGLTETERTDYRRKQDRIRELEIELFGSFLRS